MALDKEQLQSDLEDVFESMKDGDNSVFSNGISNAVVTFVSGGQVTTSDAGTLSSGAFVGSGSGTLTVEADGCASIIQSACEAMMNMESGGDDYLAEEIGKGLQKMSDEGEVKTEVSGTLTPPSSSPVPYSGSTKGTITCTSSVLVTKLKAVLKKMYDDKDDEDFDGNKELAKEMAEGINIFFTTGVVNTNGESGLSGDIGVGAIT